MTPETHPKMLSIALAGHCHENGHTRLRPMRHGTPKNEEFIISSSLPRCGKEWGVRCDRFRKTASIPEVAEKLGFYVVWADKWFPSRTQNVSIRSHDLPTLIDCF